MNLSLIKNWKEAYKMYSVWFFAIIAIFPDVYAQLSQTDLLATTPTVLLWGLKILAGLGAVSRLIQQDKLNTISDITDSVKPYFEDKK